MTVIYPVISIVVRGKPLVVPLAAMELCLGLRLVRGPDWCWEDQDGGEGSVGTLVEVGEGGRSALVQWDGGTRGRYRCGEDGKFDLRVLDTAPTGETRISLCPRFIIRLQLMTCTCMVCNSVVPTMVDPQPLFSPKTEKSHCAHGESLLKPHLRQTGM